MRHFDEHTKKYTVGTYRLLILDSHESHHSTAFKQLCKERNIITLCMLAHSSHLLQPLDVGCFSPLKKAYSCQIEYLIRSGINYITKLEFLPAFKAAYEALITRTNIHSGYQATGLVPYSPDKVLSKLGGQLGQPRTPSPDLPSQWESKTPSNRAELEL